MEPALTKRAGDLIETVRVAKKLKITPNVNPAFISYSQRLADLSQSQSFTEMNCAKIFLGIEEFPVIKWRTVSWGIKKGTPFLIIKEGREPYELDMREVDAWMVSIDLTCSKKLIPIDVRGFTSLLGACRL